MNRIAMRFFASPPRENVWLNLLDGGDNLFSTFFGTPFGGENVSRALPFGPKSSLARGSPSGRAIFPCFAEVGIFSQGGRGQIKRRKRAQILRILYSVQQKCAPLLEAGGGQISSYSRLLRDTPIQKMAFVERLNVEIWMKDKGIYEGHLSPMHQWPKRIQAGRGVFNFFS